MDNENKLIIIDFCGTLIKKQTVNLFVYYSMKKNIINITRFFYIKFIEIITNIMYKIRIINFTLDKRNYLKIIKNYNLEFLEDKAKDFILYLEKYINIDLLNYINDKYTNNKKIIASAGYEIYIKYFNQYFIFDALIASKMKFENNLFTGEIDRTVYGEDKKNYIIEKYSLSELSNCIFFSDSMSDLPTFKMAKLKYVVKPNRRMLKYAKENEWKVIK
jgi:HAD superfamily phosphoserine phosphatase-like hydrolase